MTSHTETPDSPLHQISRAGVSVWLDDLSADLLSSNELQSLVATKQVVGVTTNPAIFAAAISQGAAYTTKMARHREAQHTVAETLWQLMIDDVQLACDQLAPVFNSTDGADGRVSLEVDPQLAHDADQTLAMAQELWARVDRPNAMIKIPGTREGLPAITGALANGISVNVTLIFGVDQYREVLAAFCAGLQAAHAAGHDLRTIHSVASFFVSRVDTHIDPLLQEIGSEEATSLLGTAGLANARLAYQAYLDHEASPQWQELAALGARQQRPLWASTGVKNAAYPSDMYVTGLVAAGVVNTMPRATLEAVATHGTFAGDTITTNLAHAAEIASRLHALGIELERTASTLERQGVAKFVDAWQQLITTVEENMQSGTAQPVHATDSNGQAADRADQVSAQSTPGSLTVHVGNGLAASVKENVQQLMSTQFASNLAAQDPTLWGPEAEAEARIRLGWVEAATGSSALIERIATLRDELVAQGLTRVVLCGMGGSSLAPEVITSNENVKLTILDSTDPTQVHDTISTGLDRTVVVIASKSGSTVETDSARRAFIAAFTEAGIDAASRIIVVTDPGSPLDALAQSEKYRAIFHADPNVGGRFSALTAFGLVPSGLAGANISALLTDARVATTKLSVDTPDNPGLVLGAALGNPTTGRSKAIIVPGENCPVGIGHWIEQLVAESTGKNDTGVLPVVVDSDQAPEVHANYPDCTVIRVVGGNTGLVTPGDNEVLVHGDLGAQFQLWEVATSVCGKIFGISPFDQPDVESAKKAARGMLAEPPTAVEPSFRQDGVEVFVGQHVTSSANTVEGVLKDLLTHIPADQGYLSVMVYANRFGFPEVVATRDHLAKAAGRPVTFGWGPRFLHSTGQYHKGGPKVGCYVVITTEAQNDIAIPEQGFTFGQLITAQAHGDSSVLTDHGRPVLRLHVADSATGWKTIVDALSHV